MLNFFFTYTPLKFFGQSFWRDEAFSYLLAKRNIIDILLLTAKDFNPPLYYLILHYWMKVFGKSEVSLRLLSFIFFWATIYVVFIFMNKALRISKSWMFIYLLLFIVNPLIHYYAFEARMYSLFCFLAVFSFYLLYEKKYKEYFLITLLGLYTHYFMFLVIFSQLFYIFFNEKNKQEFINLLKIFGKIILLFIPWLLLIFMAKPPISGEFWILRPTLLTIIELPAILFTGFENDRQPWYTHLYLIGLSVFILFLIVGAGKLMTHNRQKIKYIYLLIWSFLTPVITLIISVVKPIFLPRYIIFTNIGLILLVIYSLQNFQLQYRKILLIILFVFSLSYASYQVNYRDKANIRKVVLEIKYVMNKNDVIYVTNIYDFHPAEYYLNENHVFIYGKTYEEIPWFVGKILIPKEKIATSLPTYPSKAFILKNDLTYEVQAKY